MLNRLPTGRDCPDLQRILSDIGSPTNKEIADALGVSVRSVQLWRRENFAPRPAMLALFWLTSYGQSVIDAEAVNNARLQFARAKAYELELKRTKRQLAYVLRLNATGAANEPLYKSK